MKKAQRGFALLIAIVFMSVMLTFGLALGSLAYKQQKLASSATESQYAFYAADAALECALHADQRDNSFAYPSSDPGVVPAIKCNGANAILPPYSTEVWNNNQPWVVKERFSLDAGTHCADVTIYKPKPNTGATTYIFSQGYDVSCATVATPGANFVARGLQAHYQ